MSLPSDNYPGKVEQSHVFEDNLALRRLFGEVAQIEEPFILVPEHGAGSEEIDEFYSRKLGSHVLSFCADSDVGRAHSQLAEATKLTLPSISVGANIILLPPGGSKSVEKILPLIPRNINVYSEIFTKLGKATSALGEAGLFFTSGAKMLQGYTYVPIGDTDGFSVKLTPPYGFTPEANLYELPELEVALQAQGVLSDAQTDLLLSRFESGRQQL